MRKRKLDLSNIKITNPQELIKTTPKACIFLQEVRRWFSHLSKIEGELDLNGRIHDLEKAVKDLCLSEKYESLFRPYYHHILKNVDVVIKNDIVYIADQHGSEIVIKLYLNESWSIGHKNHIEITLNIDSMPRKTYKDYHRISLIGVPGSWSCCDANSPAKLITFHDAFLALKIKELLIDKYGVNWSILDLDRIYQACVCLKEPFRSIFGIEE